MVNLKIEARIELKKLKKQFILDLLWIQQLEDGEVSLNSNWKNFLGEGLDEKTIFTYIQGLEEIISNQKPRTMTEKRRISLAKQHLREVKRYARRMQNEVNILQEKLTILEESRGDK